MKKLIISLIALIMATAMPVTAGDIYVAAGGNDNADGTQSHPLLTPQAALKMAREWRRLHKKEIVGGITIHLQGGVYRLAKPLFVRPEDSGTKDSPTIIIGDNGANPTVISGGVTLDEGRHAVTVNDRPVSLTLKEYELLKLFLENIGQVFSREALLSRVWDADYAGETRTVDVHVGTLRTKLAECGGLIETVRGVGYKMEGGK